MRAVEGRGFRVFKGRLLGLTGDSSIRMGPRHGGCVEDIGYPGRWGRKGGIVHGFEE
jgi:hypothetical protein